MIYLAIFFFTTKIESIQIEHQKQVTQIIKREMRNKLLLEYVLMYIYYNSSGKMARKPQRNYIKFMIKRLPSGQLLVKSRM